MQYIIQAFTGAYEKALWKPREILDRITAIMDTLPVQAVIIGWHTDAALYKELIDEVHKQGKEIFLWLPVFSEMSSVQNVFRAIDFSGTPHAGTVHEDEDFSFLCPSRGQNVDAVKGIFENYFSMLDFDGVFLDKIRYSSFGGGFRSAMGCFCDECKRTYAQNNVNLDKIISLMRVKEKPFLVPNALEEMRYTFEHPLFDSFFRVRADIIAGAVSELADWFRMRGLKVGLDVYAPVFAYFVGQDIAALSRSADFIKPMLYRATDAPAGIPYESRRMREELCANGCEEDGQIERLWGAEDICGTLSLQAQIEKLKRVSCPVYIGMEVNYKPGVCSADEAYVTDTIGAIKRGGLGCVLSWDVLSDTRNHLPVLSGMRLT